jgi:hypothetical protein
VVYGILAEAHCVELSLLWRLEGKSHGSKYAQARLGM